MDRFIENPMENKDWDPSTGDYYNKIIIEEDKKYKLVRKRRKFFVLSLIFVHFILLAIAFSI